MTMQLLVTDREVAEWINRGGGWSWGGNNRAGPIHKQVLCCFGQKNAQNWARFSCSVKALLLLINVLFSRSIFN